ncbi:hypothetical protein SS209_02248 [Salmonella enterica subsp. enterica serovar Senftenberg str. SS209]|nr:hypothetical protein SS209_02248 [Salmonella enterica subsp. enterica serovar Senftenberg str. SS209]
MSIPDE